MGLSETPEPRTGDLAADNQRGQNSLIAADSTGQTLRLLAEPVAGQGGILKSILIDSAGSPADVTPVSGKNSEYFSNVAQGTGATTLTFALTSRTIIIDNLSEIDAPANELLVSFDGGSSFVRVRSGANLTVELQRASIDVKAGAGTVSYQILVVQP